MHAPATAAALTFAFALMVTAPPVQAAGASSPGAAATAAGPTAPMDYQRRAVTVYGLATSPIARMLRDDLKEAGRFTWVEAQVAASEPVDAYVKAVNGMRSRLGGAYVLVPRLSFGTTRSTTPRIDKDENKDGSWRATAYAHLEVAYTLSADLIDSATGKRIETLSHSDTLQRRFEYRYDDRTSVEAIQYKAHQLARVMAREAGKPPAVAFGAQAARAEGGLASGLVAALKAHPLFRLEVQLSGWSDVKERLYFNLGKDVRVGLDDGFALMKGDRQIGYLKVRDLDAGLSGAQPLWLEETLATTDRVVEAPKAMWNHGLRAGAAWLGGPIGSFGYAGEVNVGPAWFRASERYLTFDGAFVTNFVSGGAAFNLGYAHKYYLRRWALKVGGKAGVMAGVAGDFPLPGAALVSGLEYHFSEHVLWGTDLDLAAYWPYVSLRGPLAGQTVYTIGPVLRSGVTVLF